MNIFSKLNLSENAVKVAKNIGWALLGKVATLLGSFIVGIFVARYLGPEQYGLMSYVIAYVSIFQTLALFGMDNIEIREEAKNKEDRDAIIGTAFVLKVFLSLITMAVIAVMMTFSKTDTYTKWMIVLYSLSVIFNSFSVIRNYFTAIVWNEYVVKSEIFRTIIGMVIKVFLLLVHASLSWFIASMMFDFVLLGGGYCLSYSKKIDSMSLWHFDKEWAKVLLRQSFPLMLTTSAVIVYQRIDQVMLGDMLDNTAVGQFSVASKIVEMLVFVPSIICQTVMPILADIFKKDKTAYCFKAQRVMNVTVWLSILLSVVACLLSYYIMLFTFGKDFMSAIPILRVLSFKLIAVALSNAAGYLLIIEGLQDYAIFRDVLGCVVCVALNLVLIPVLGAVGSAIVAIVSNFVAGYLADLVIPKYRHLFRMQTRAIFTGWKDVVRLKEIVG